MVVFKARKEVPKIVADNYFKTDIALQFANFDKPLFKTLIVKYLTSPSTMRMVSPLVPASCFHRDPRSHCLCHNCSLFENI